MSSARTWARKAARAEDGAHPQKPCWCSAGNEGTWGFPYPGKPPVGWFIGVILGGVPTQQKRIHMLFWRFERETKRRASSFRGSPLAHPRIATSCFGPTRRMLSPCPKIRNVGSSGCREQNTRQPMDPNHDLRHVPPGYRKTMAMQL